MIKKQQKWIALLVTFAFVWLLQVSTMPLAASSAPEQIGSASVEQAPSFIEQEGDAGYQAKKKSILPIVLIGVGVVAVAAVLFLVVLKTKYDITGNWTLTWQFQGYPEGTHAITFNGDKKSGTFDIGGSIGTYTADGKKVTWTYSDGNTVYTGEFTDKTHMNGTMMSHNIPGTWSAVKLSSTASYSAPASVSKALNGELLK